MSLEFAIAMLALVAGEQELDCNCVAPMAQIPVPFFNVQAWDREYWRAKCIIRLCITISYRGRSLLEVAKIAVTGAVDSKYRYY
ncbi:hypothetical protein BGX38DRAFT_1183020 [Terfezia claveryi]|nr:hypothetical protein BGX38DRAFT_1183020 [Terfezia claveryi]